MAPNYSTNSTAAFALSHSIDYVNSPAFLPLTLPSTKRGPFMEPGQGPRTGQSLAPPYTEHDLEVVGQNSTTPPLSYTEPRIRVIIDDSKILPHAYDPPSPSLRIGLSPKPIEDGNSLYVGAPKEPNSPQVGVTVLLKST